MTAILARLPENLKMAWETPLKHAEESWFKDGTIIFKLYTTCVAFKVYEGFLSLFLATLRVIWYKYAL